jgi:hypothetical protein
MSQQARDWLISHPHTGFLPVPGSLFIARPRVAAERSRTLQRGHSSIRRRISTSAGVPPLP